MTDQSRFHQRWFFFYLMITAIICGALVMVIEVLGSRVIGPFFGISLFIWTALISVTLISLSLGYAFGGWLSDRKDHADYLYGIILLAGISVILIPVSKPVILKFCVPLGLRLGSFLSSTLLFGTSLFLLGCVSPYLIKIAAREIQKIGTTVGSFYALSTVGSVIGTVITGYFLIAYMGINRIFLLTGSLLILLSLIYFFGFRKIKSSLAILLLFPLLFLPIETSLPISIVMKNGTRSTLIANHESYYGNLKVVDYSFNTAHTREMMIDGMIQGGIDMNNGMPVYEYFYFLQFLPYAIKPDIQSTLTIGLGAGVIPQWYEKQGIPSDVVDINPLVYDFAEQYFGFSVRGDRFIQDARYFLTKNRKKYDVIILDVFNGDTTPAHLLSVESLMLAKNNLSEDGILAVNMLGNIYRETFMTMSVIKTFRHVFNHVDIYLAFDPEKTNGEGNLILIANKSDKNLQPDLRRIADFPVHNLAKNIVFKNIRTPYVIPEDSDAILLTDDYNPLDLYDTGIKESIRNHILNSTEWDILVYSG